MQKSRTPAEMLGWGPRPGPSAQVYSVKIPEMKVELAKFSISSVRDLFRAFSASEIVMTFPGRCPGLSHFAPLALRTKRLIWPLNLVSPALSACEGKPASFGPERLRA